MTVDPLAEVVTLLRPTVCFSKLVECIGPWKIHREGTGDPFFCAVLEGECRVIAESQLPMTLQAGDFLLVPALSDLIHESLVPPEVETTKEPVPMGDGCYRVGDEDGPVSLRMRIGHCRFSSPDAALLVPLLPQVILVRSEPRLAALMQFVDEETRGRRPARELVLERLLEVLLIEALRSAGETKSAPGLARGLADERLAAALRAIHARPDHSWTIAALSAEASMSRSAFFVRFNKAVGLPPMEYLLSWRMALARQLLCEQELSMDQVAERIGYSSASTFSVAFVRHAGVTPARYGRMALNGRHPADF